VNSRVRRAWTSDEAFAFLPFGAGGHNGSGCKFIALEAKSTGACCPQIACEIAPPQCNAEHAFTNAVAMKAKPGLKVVVKARCDLCKACEINFFYISCAWPLHCYSRELFFVGDH